MAGPTAASSKKWILAVLAGGLGCCCFSLGAVALVGASTAPDGAAAPDFEGTPAPQPGDDDEAGVVYQAGQLAYVAQAQVVARAPGLPQPPEGVWKEDKTHFALRLEAGGAYTLVYQANGPSGGVGYVERGGWRGEGEALVLAPSALQRSSAFVLSDTPGVKVNAESEALAPGPPRAYRVAAAQVDYVANWKDPAPVVRKEGLMLVGPPPPEYWTGGAPLELVLRRARHLRVH